MGNTIEEKINDILLDLLDITPPALKPERTLRQIGASSIDLVEIYAALENEFDLDISDEEGEKIKTLQDLYEYINDKVPH